MPIPLVAEPMSFAYKPWTLEADEELLRLFYDAVDFKDIATQLHRSRKAIIDRLRKLGK